MNRDRVEEVVDHPLTPPELVLRYAQSRTIIENGTPIARFSYADASEALGLDYVDTLAALSELEARGRVEFSVEAVPLDDIPLKARTSLSIDVPGVDRGDDQPLRQRFAVRPQENPAVGCERCDYRGIVRDRSEFDGIEGIIRPVHKPCPDCEPRCPCGRLATKLIYDHSGVLAVLWCGRADDIAPIQEALPDGQHGEWWRPR